MYLFFLASHAHVYRKVRVYKGYAGNSNNYTVAKKPDNLSTNKIDSNDLLHCDIALCV